MQFVRQAAFAAALAVACAGATGGAAGVLIDQGPAGSPVEVTTRLGPHTVFVSNQYDFQEFFVRADLTQDSVVRGMALTSGTGYAPIGTEVVLRVFADLGGDMGGEIAQRYGAIDETVDLPWTFVDRPGNVVLAHGSFADLKLAAGTYWFGMSSRFLPDDIGWVPFKEDGAPKARFDQTQISHDVYEPGDVVFFDSTDFYRLPYVIDGAIPEPSTWALLIAGFGLTGAAMRRRRSVIHAYASGALPPG